MTQTARVAASLLLAWLIGSLLLEPIEACGGGGAGGMGAMRARRARAQARRAVSKLANGANGANAANAANAAPAPQGAAPQSAQTAGQQSAPSPASQTIINHVHINQHELANAAKASSRGSMSLDQVDDDLLEELLRRRQRQQSHSQSAQARWQPSSDLMPAGSSIAAQYQQSPTYPAHQQRQPASFASQHQQPAQYQQQDRYQQAHQYHGYQSANGPDSGVYYDDAYQDPEYYDDEGPYGSYNQQYDEYMPATPSNAHQNNGQRALSPLNTQVQPQMAISACGAASANFQTQESYQIQPPVNPPPCNQQPQPQQQQQQQQQQQRQPLRNRIPRRGRGYGSRRGRR